MLFGAYYVLNLHYPDGASITLEFIQRYGCWLYKYKLVSSPMHTSYWTTWVKWILKWKQCYFKKSKIVSDCLYCFYSFWCQRLDVAFKVKKCATFNLIVKLSPFKFWVIVIECVCIVFLFFWASDLPRQLSISCNLDALGFTASVFAGKAIHMQILATLYDLLRIQQFDTVFYIFNYHCAGRL